MRVSQRGRLRESAGACSRREKRQTLTPGDSFALLVSRARLPEGDSLGLLPTIDVNGPPGGWPRGEGKNHVPMSIGRRFKYFVCLALREEREGETRVRKKKGMQSATDSSGDRTRYGEHRGTATHERSYHVSVLRGTPLG